MGIAISVEEYSIHTIHRFNTTDISFNLNEICVYLDMAAVLFATQRLA